MCCLFDEGPLEVEAFEVEACRFTLDGFEEDGFGVFENEAVDDKDEVGDGGGADLDTDIDSCVWAELAE